MSLFLQVVLLTGNVWSCFFFILFLFRLDTVENIQCGKYISYSPSFLVSINFLYTFLYITHEILKNIEYNTKNIKVLNSKHENFAKDGSAFVSYLKAFKSSFIIKNSKVTPFIWTFITFHLKAFHFLVFLYACVL